MEKLKIKVNAKLLIIGFLCLIGIIGIVGYTYSFFAVNTTNNTSITGTAASLNIDLQITKIAPSNSEGLIPQLDGAITNAVIGRNGSCIDDNNNNVCQVYQITITNKSGATVNVDGTIELDATNNPNLKWARISGTTSPTLLGNIYSYTEKKLTSNEKYKGGETKIYYIVVWISETGLAQNDTGIFTGMVTIDSTDPMLNSNVTFASYTVNGTETTNYPLSGIYTVNPNCTNATVIYDYSNDKFLISNITTVDKINCSPILTTTTRTTLAEHIISLSGTPQGTGEVVNENGYRYEGLNPNNYVKFNDELWRIIGVFGEESHGVPGTNLVKIIRNDSIGGYVWDNDTTNTNYGDNNWPDSDLYNLLNTYYYNAVDGTDSGYCYGYTNTLTSNCDYTIGGVSDYYRPMVENTKWYLGGLVNSSATSEGFYNAERGSTVYVGNDTITDGYIGLMYPSDLGYSVLSSSCARTTDLYNYNSTTCSGSSWLYKEGEEWTITAGSPVSYGIFYYSHKGNLAAGIAYRGYNVRPTLYLETSVYIINGTGTQIDPYIINM